MKPLSDHRQKILIHSLGFVFFLVLSVLSIVFFRERVLHSDNAYYLFKIFQDGNYDIEVNRYCNLITQSLPLLALKLGLSTKSVALLFSFSFILITYLFFLLVVIRFRDYTSGFAIMVSSVLVVRYVFYLPVSEFYQGIILSIVLWSYLNRFPNGTKRKWEWYVVSLALLFLSSFFHPLNALTTFFVLVLFLIRHPQAIKRLLIIFSLFVLYTFYKFKVMSVDSLVEMTKVPTLHQTWERFSVLTERKTYIYIETFIFHHVPFIASIIILVLVCVWQKRYLLMLYSLISAAAFFMFFAVTLPDFESPFMLENYLCGIGVCISLPLFISMDRLNIFIRAGVAAFLLLISTLTIYQAHFLITDRVNYIAGLCRYGKTLPEKKYLISVLHYPWKYAWAKWTLPFETLTYQAVEDPGNPVTFYPCNNMSELDTLISDPSFFLGPEWDHRTYNWWDYKLNKKYYNLPHKGYRKLSSGQDEPDFDEAVFSKNNFSLSIAESVYRSHADSFIVVPVTISNRSGKLFRTIRKEKTDASLSYHLLDSEGRNVIDWDGPRTSINIDFTGDYTQGLIVEKPKEKGDFIIVIDMVTEGKRWWGLDCKFILVNK